MGPAGVIAAEMGLVDVGGFVHGVAERVKAHVVPGDAHVAPAVRQLAEYFRGSRTTFNLPLDLSQMTAFQQAVLRMTAVIPFGQTLTYGEVARRIGHPKASRAVGGALKANPIPIIIPCHRVVGAGGRLVGFSAPGGLGTKASLLHFEAAKMEPV
ncbi:MAG: methylated-DNA--[protein]-cysteine S-methyltransferase, partial [Chloroflexi bacterium]|nr:methylated-DNA--[protein]-cysteine S-methyltransferase [Chloroflexota bacterium]